MLLLIFYFILLFPLLLIWGQVPYWLLKKSGSTNPFDDLLMGLIVLSLVSMGLVLGGPINGLTQGIMLFTTLSLGWLWREQLIQRWSLFKAAFKGMSAQRIALRLALAVPVLYQSAQATKINDYGAYYLQTIQWMEKFGVVKGLANLYPPLGLFGTWHSLTALCDFNQIGLGNTHYLNGLLMLVWIFWSLREWELAVFQFHRKIVLLISTAFILVLGFFFLTAPSADLPILVFSAWLFHRSLFEENKLHGFLALLVAFSLFWIKPPATAALVLGAFRLLQKDWSLKSKSYSLMALFPFLVLGLTKNTLLSGYPLYPMSSPDWLNLEWKVPADWNAVYRKGIASWGQNDNPNPAEFESAQEPVLKKLGVWLSRAGYKGLMNKAIFGIALLAPLGLAWAMRRKQVNRLQLALFAGLLFALGLDWLFLRQYRLLLTSTLILLLMATYLVLNASQKSSWLASLAQSGGKLYWGLALMLAIFAWVPFSAFREQSRNKNITQSEGFNSRYLIFPWQKFEHGELATWELGGMTFRYYPERGYCWDAPLPCISRSHHSILLKSMQLEIRPLGKRPQDGFRLEKINPVQLENAN